MEWMKALDISREIEQIAKKLVLSHIDTRKIICFRSFGSKSRASARIWSLPRVWQQALGVAPHYVIEVLAKKFDKLGRDDQRRVLIHELAHIPKTFSGSLVPHRGRVHRIDNKLVEKLFQLYKKVK